MFPKQQCSHPKYLQYPPKLTRFPFLPEPLQSLCNSSILFWEPPVSGACLTWGFCSCLLLFFQLVLLSFKGCYTPVTRMEKKHDNWEQGFKPWDMKISPVNPTGYLKSISVEQNRNHSLLYQSLPYWHNEVLPSVTKSLAHSSSTPGTISKETWNISPPGSCFQANPHQSQIKIGRWLFRSLFKRAHNPAPQTNKGKTQTTKQKRHP